MYICDACNYQSNKKSNYNRHVTSAKHQENIVPAKNPRSKNFECGRCRHKFESNRDLQRHLDRKKQCKININNSVNINGNNNIVGDNNTIININGNVNPESFKMAFQELAEYVELTKYEKFYINHVRKNANNVGDIQEMFSHHAELIYNKYEQEQQRIIDNHKERFGDDEDIPRFDRIQVPLSSIIIDVFMDIVNHPENLSLIRIPRLDDKGEIVAKYNDSLHDLSVIQMLIDSCPLKEYIDPNAWDAKTTDSMNSRISESYDKTINEFENMINKRMQKHQYRT